MLDGQMDFVDRLLCAFVFPLSLSLPSAMRVRTDAHPFALSCRPTTGVPSPPAEPTESPPAKPNVQLNRQSSDELNAQQGKRKFSLSQYKERKRLKSNEPPQDSLADTDMRMNHLGQSKVRTEEWLSPGKSRVAKAVARGLELCQGR